MVPAPKDLKVDKVGATSLDLRWTKAEELEKIPHEFNVPYVAAGTEPLAVFTDNCNETLADLLPNTKYSVSVSSVLDNGEESEPVSTTAKTGE